MPRPLPLLAATVSTVLTGPILYHLSPVPLAPPGAALAREKEAGESGKSKAEAKGKSESKGKSDAPGPSSSGSKPERVSQAQAERRAGPGGTPAAPSPAPDQTPDQPDPGPDLPPQPIPDPGPDLPPAPPREVPDTPPVEAPTELPGIDLPDEGPPISDPAPSDTPTEVPQIDLPPAPIPGMPTMALAPAGEGLDRLQPYAEQLLELRRLTAARDEAAVELAALEALPPEALARQYPPSGPDYDVTALARDLRRLEGAGPEYIRLTQLNAAELAREFPPADPAMGYDTEAYTAAQRRALVQARDYNTLLNLSPERRAALYPAPEAEGHDRDAHQADLRRLRARLAAATTALSAAGAQAEQIRLSLTGDRPLTATEADWLAGYLNG